MPIETLCQRCGSKLRVGDEHAGKKARCPQCGNIYTVPDNERAVEPDPETAVPQAPGTASSPEGWHLKIDDGTTFGPVPKEQLDRWMQEGRITPRSQILNDRQGRWLPAGEIYPQLGSPQNVKSPSDTVNPFRDTDVNPYASSSAYPSRAAFRGEPHRGVLILVLGILGMTFCAFIAIPAVIMGHSDLAKMNRGAMDPEGRGLTIAGLIFGWLACASLIFLGCFFGLMIAAGN